MGRSTEEADTPILEVAGLTVVFGQGRHAVRAVEDVCLTVPRGEVVAVVGESGCGKSTLAYALLGLVPPPGRIVSGEVRFKGRSLSVMNETELRRLRGCRVAMVFQAAMNSFNPVLTIGKQVQHLLAAHPEVFSSEQEGREYFSELLELCRLSPEQIWQSYESQLSGGMKQRVAIAMALLFRPDVVVLDEPTTALDALNQRLVIEELKQLRDELSLTIITITHDLAVVAELATRVAVMYAGRLVEAGSVDDIFEGNRRHPYVTALIAAIPSVLAGGLNVRPIRGEVPNLADLPPGCRFAPRCELAEPVCVEMEPALLGEPGQHVVACHVVNRPLARTL